MGRRRRAKGTRRAHSVGSHGSSEAGNNGMKKEMDYSGSSITDCDTHI